MYCSKCGAKLVDNAQFCSSCGNQIQNAEPAMNKPPAPMQPRQKSRGCGCVLSVFIAICIVSMIFVIAITSDGDSSLKDSSDVIVDLSQFSRISYVQLVQLMGGEGEKDPDGITLTTNAGEQCHADLFFYKDKLLEFMIADDQVIRATYNSPAYYDTNGDSIPYSKEQQIPSMFGIELNEKAAVIASTPTAYRISPVNDAVADFWVTLMDADNKTFNQVKVTYNLNYFN